MSNARSALHNWPIRLLFKKLNITFFIFIFFYLNLSYFLLDNKYSAARSLLSIDQDISASINFREDTVIKPTIYDNVSVLVFPRVPKTGGKNFLTTLKLIIPKTRFIANSYAGSAYIEDKDRYSFAPHEVNDLHLYSEDNLRDYLQNTLIKDWNEKQQRRPNASLYMCQYHLPFLTLNNTDITSILHTESSMKWKYISMIRKPSDRIVSSFYYLRGQSGGWRSWNAKYMNDYVPKLIEMQRNYTIDECVESYNDGDNICYFSSNYYVKWFCGGDPNICNVSNINENSYNRAIQNIDKYFTWIGVLEYYRESVRLLYNTFPLFFMHLDNLTVIEEKLENIIWRMKYNRNASGYGNYQRASEKSIEILDRKNSLDWKLYSYVVTKYGYH